MSDYCTVGFEFSLNASKGWQCPTCGKIYAPWVSECHGCSSGVPAYQPGNTDWPFPWSDPTTNPSGTGDPIPSPFTIMSDYAGNVTDVKALRVVM